MTKQVSRLEKLYYRIEAQHKCLAWAFEHIKSRKGLVFELGLGHGRTFDHLRLNLPDHDIYVFDRAIGSYPECTPDSSRIILGDLTETLPAAAARFAGQVVLAHSDVGSFSAGHNSTMPKIVSAGLPHSLAPGALILSDLPLSIAGTERLPLPAGVRADRYYIYRFAPS